VKTISTSMLRHRAAADAPVFTLWGGKLLAGGR
jgi:hypothetical protein